MSSIPVPIKQSRYEAGDNLFDFSDDSPGQKHQCYSYPCYICQANIYKSKESFYPPPVSRSYICVDKKLSQQFGSYDDKDENNKDNYTNDNQQVDGSFHVLNNIVNEQENITDKYDDEDNNIDEPMFEMDMMYESIDDLPESVFTGIAAELMEQCEQYA